MNCVVLPDTNVVVAASIRVISNTLDTVVEPHHKESRRLLDALSDADSGCRCVVSPTVASEVHRVVRRAATRAIDKVVGVHAIKSKAEFAETIRMRDACVEQSSRFLSSMTLYDLPPSLVEANLAEVDKMVEEIGKRRAELLVELASRQAAGAQAGPAGAGRLGAGRALVWPGQYDLAQYERFFVREPLGNTMDKRILAEAITIRDIIPGGSGRFCIASNDRGIFAPLGLRGGRESRPIVDMIHDRFGITSGLPSAICALCMQG